HPRRVHRRLLPRTQLSDPARASRAGKPCTRRQVGAREGPRPGMSILGAVLTGGRSSRFGSNKAFAMLGGNSLASHARASIQPYCADVIQVGGADGIPDQPEPGLGPLGGIAGALDHAAAHGFRCVLTIGCDMPRLPEGLIEALLRREPSYCEDAPVLGL